MTEPEGTPVDTHEFRRSSVFSRWLRRRLRAVIVPRLDPSKRDAQISQLDEASRNVEIAAEGLLRMVRHHPAKTVSVLRAVADWLVRYFRTQRGLARRDRYVVYTQHDHEIPFIPAEDTLYAYMIAQIAYVANELAGALSARSMRDIARAFIEMNDIGVAAFERHPTVMPRFVDHDRLTLSVVQALDKPLNCCPSLHIAYSLLLDNIARFALGPLRGRSEVLEAIRFSTVGMFNSVLYTKQHAVLDVAFGMLCAKMVFERRFALPFEDFVSVFPTLAAAHPIPYRRIVEIYEEASAIEPGRDGLAGVLGTYLRRHGYVAISPAEESRPRYFDTEQRRLFSF